MNVIEKKPTTSVKRSKRKCAKYLDSSVKKLFILAIVKGAPETYHNVKTIMKALNLEKVPFSFCLATDLKLQNILMGIQSSSSKYPCAYCESPRPFTKIGLIRTLGRIRELSKKFEEDGASKKDAKDYFNVIQAPLIEGADEDSVMDILSIPELHLLIGIGKILFLFHVRKIYSTQNFRKKNYFFHLQ